MVVRSLTDIKNNFVRSYPEKRTRGKIGNEGAQNARAHRAGVFAFKICMICTDAGGSQQAAESKEEFKRTAFAIFR